MEAIRAAEDAKDGEEKKALQNVARAKVKEVLTVMKEARNSLAETTGAENQDGNGEVSNFILF